MGKKNALVPTEEADGRKLTRQEFHGLADVPPEIEWFANIRNARTRREYADDLRDFMGFVGIARPEEFRTVTRAHVIAWREDLVRRRFAPSSVRRKLSALSSLFEYLCEKNAVTHNPVKGVKRPKAENNEGKTPAIGDEQARALLSAPLEDTLKGVRDRAILATFFYQGLRRQELCDLRVRDYQRRGGVMVFCVHGKRDKIRYVEVEPITQHYLALYLGASGHGDNLPSPLFRPVRNRSTTQGIEKHLNPKSVYDNIVLHYAKQVGITADTHGFCVHSGRATAITNALENGADFGRVQEWAGHANISTTRMYYKLRKKVEDSPSFKVRY